MFDKPKSAKAAASIFADPMVAKGGTMFENKSDNDPTGKAKETQNEGKKSNQTGGLFNLPNNSTLFGGTNNIFNNKKTENPPSNIFAPKPNNSTGTSAQQTSKPEKTETSEGSNVPGNNQTNVSLPTKPSNSLFSGAGPAQKTSLGLFGNQPNDASKGPFFSSNKTEQKPTDQKAAPLFAQSGQTSKPNFFNTAQNEQKSTNTFANTTQAASLFGSNQTGESKSGGLFGQKYQLPKGGLFSSNPSEQKQFTLALETKQTPKENLFSSKESKPLFGQQNSTAKMGLFGSLFTGQNKQSLNDDQNPIEEQKGKITGPTLESLTGKSSMKDSLEEAEGYSSEVKNQVEEEKTQSKNEGLQRSIIKEESHEYESKIKSSEVIEPSSDELEKKKQQILTHLNKLKDEKKEFNFTAQFIISEYFQIETQRLDKKIKKESSKAEQLKKKEAELKEINDSKKAELEGLKSNQTEFSFNSLVKKSQQNSKKKSYPNDEDIEKETASLIDVVKDYYILPVKILSSEIQEDPNPEKILKDLKKQTEDSDRKFNSLMNQMQFHTDQNKKTLLKIQGLKSFGKFMESSQPPDKSKTEAYVEMKRKVLEEELQRLTEQNQKKTKKYEEKRSQIRKWSPSSRGVTGQSSIVMKSVIFE